MIKLISIWRTYEVHHEMSNKELLSPILSSLKFETPQAWINEAAKP